MREETVEESRSWRRPLQFQKATFLTTCVTLKQLPEQFGTERLLPEIALIGRSNVGKSSLLNHLFQRRRLARTSSTPGKTRALNFYAVDERLIFVDLPGYGYARGAREERADWETLIGSYTKQRKQLQAILMLIDSRHDLSPLDRNALEWLAAQEKAPLIVFTKVDKLKKSRAKAVLSSLTQAVRAHAKESLCIPFSIHDTSSRQALIEALENSLGGMI